MPPLTLFLIYFNTGIIAPNLFTAYVQSIQTAKHVPRYQHTAPFSVRCWRNVPSTVHDFWLQRKPQLGRMEKHPSFPSSGLCGWPQCDGLLRCKSSRHAKGSWGPGPWEAKQGLISHRAEAYYNWWKQDFQRTYLFHPSQTFAQELAHCISLKNAWYFPWHHSWTLGWGATLSSLQGLNHCPPCFYTSIWAYTNATDFIALY